MKITRIRAYHVDLPLHEGTYKWSGGKSVDVFDSTVVEVETDAGLVGHGEVCPLGPFYLPAYADGVRAGLVLVRATPSQGIYKQDTGEWALGALPVTARPVVGPACRGITPTCGAGRPHPVGRGAGVGSAPSLTVVVLFPEWKTAR